MNDNHMESVSLIQHILWSGGKLSCEVTICYSIISLKQSDTIKTGTLLDHIGQVVMAIQVFNEAQHIKSHMSSFCSI